jgi:hypothetical protein
MVLHIDWFMFLTWHDYVILETKILCINFRFLNVDEAL